MQPTTDNCQVVCKANNTIAICHVSKIKQNQILQGELTLDCISSSNKRRLKVRCALCPWWYEMLLEEPLQGKLLGPATELKSPTQRNHKLQKTASCYMSQPFEGGWLAKLKSCQFNPRYRNAISIQNHRQLWLLSGDEDQFDTMSC